MPVENEEQFEAWGRLKPGSVFAVKSLKAALDASEASADDVLEAYLFAKRSLAQSMRTLQLSQLPARCREFHELRAQLEEQMAVRYADRIPRKFLRAPYTSKAHELIFTILLQSLGEPVDNARLRLVNQDNTHTERRTRELRELGLNITTSEADGNRYYTLVDLEIDFSKIPELVAKEIKKSKSLPEAEKSTLNAILSQ